ncbi:hypothetical protein TeGR_g14759, partial [Tetraparma gracilis]
MPPSFLRVPDYAGVGGVQARPDPAPQPAPGSQMSQDELLARMLQDELFVSEIAQNPEFAYLAQGGGGGGRMPRSVREANAAARFGAASSGAGSPGSLPASSAPEPKGIGEQLGNMTDEAKRRMSLFARNFTNRKKKNQPHDAEAA